MKQIPLTRKRNALFLWGKINRSVNIEFLLDTGCSGTLLSKEVGDILFLKGNLLESDIKGSSTSSFGGIYTTEQKDINIRNLSFGRVRIKDFSAAICDRYGGPTLLGMSALDKLGCYSITKDMLIIDDGNSETSTITGKYKDRKPSITRFNGCIKRIRTIREKSGMEDYMFDYTKHVMLIFYPIQSCYPLLLNKKYSTVIEVLEELQTLIKENLEDDEKHIHQKGAFITAYFYFYLASAYYGLERYKEALIYYDKAKAFFLSGSSILNEINEVTKKIQEKIEESENSEEEETKIFVPAKTTTFEEDVISYNLHHIDFEDSYYGTGEIKSGYIGFQNFNDAYRFCRMNHKRLEILNKKDGKWQRTGLIPSDDLFYKHLQKENGYVFYSYFDNIDDDLKKITELSEGDSEKNNQVILNAKEAKKIFENEKDAGRYYSAVVLHNENLAFDALIKPGANISWHEQGIVLAALDIEELVTKKISDDVLAGKIIPCAYGQMPEDYIYLADKTTELKTYCEEDYSANNNPERSRTMGPFILYDISNNVGYGYRSTYDDKYWRWESVEHCDLCGFPRTGDDTSEENDKQVCYWQLVVKRDEDNNGIIHPEAI